MINAQYSIYLDCRGGVYTVEQVLNPVKEQVLIQKRTIQNSGMVGSFSTDTFNTVESTLESTESIADEFNIPRLLETKSVPTPALNSSSPLEHALLLSSSYFSDTVATQESHNETAYYTIITQALGLCELRNEVNYRIALLHNLALYFYTKTASQLNCLKPLEDVLELSPKQRSIATCYNNLAFMQLSARILQTEDRNTLEPFKSSLEQENQQQLFKTIEIELLIALNQLDKAFEKNRSFANQACSNPTTQNAYYHLHNFLIYQASKNYLEAKHNLEQALEAFENTRCDRTLATCHHYLSELYEHLGYYNQALEHIKTANRYEAKVKATAINLSELERLHTQFRKKIITPKNNQTHNFN